jgi:hypothetical protein
MAKNKGSKKRTRESKPYEDKQKIITSFGSFDTEAAFDAWRNGPLIKPWWDMFVSGFLEISLFRRGKKVADFENLYTWIQDGEKRGNAKFLGQKQVPSYDDETDWHAWITFWLVEENRTNKRGCFYSSRLGKEDIFKIAFHYVIYAKRERSRALAKPTPVKSPKTKPKKTVVHNTPAMSSEESDVEETSLNPKDGVITVTWDEGLPNDLAFEMNFNNRILVREFCGYSLMGFWQEVDRRFELGSHKQRLVAVENADDMSLKRAQVHASKHQFARYILETEASDLPAKVTVVGGQVVAAPEGVTEGMVADGRGDQ